MLRRSPFFELISDAGAGAKQRPRDAGIARRTQAAFDVALNPWYRSKYREMKLAASSVLILTAGQSIRSLSVDDAEIDGLRTVALSGVIWSIGMPSTSAAVRRCTSSPL
jgi:hypothetical protein